jgi:hypothetical protein
MLRIGNNLTAYERNTSHVDLAFRSGIPNRCHLVANYPGGRPSERSRPATAFSGLVDYSNLVDYRSDHDRRCWAIFTACIGPPVRDRAARQRRIFFEGRMNAWTACTLQGHCPRMLYQSVLRAGVIMCPLDLGSLA